MTNDGEVLCESVITAWELCYLVRERSQITKGTDRVEVVLFKMVDEALQGIKINRAAGVGVDKVNPLLDN